MIWIEEKLKQQGLRNRSLREEYFDHFASHYEALQEDGISENQAYSATIKSIEQLDINHINQQHINLTYKPKLIMLSISFLFISTLFILTGFGEPPSIFPVDTDIPNISSTFGQRLHPTEKTMKFHHGIDIKAKMGTGVLATSDGVIADSGYDKLNGFYIEIQHDEKYSTRYHHLSKIDVKRNQTITKGQKIGEIGSTGMSTGPHLHYEVLKNGQYIDPAPFMNL